MLADILSLTLAVTLAASPIIIVIYIVKYGYPPDC